MTDLNSQSTPVAEHELSPVSTSTSIVQALKQKRAQLMTGFPSSKSGFGRRIFSKLSEIDLNKIKTMVETRMMMKKAKRVFRFLDLPRELRDVIYRLVLVTDKPIAPRSHHIICFNVKCGRNGLTAIRDGHQFHKNRQLGILGVNKQVCKEACQTLFCENVFALEDEMHWSSPEPRVHYFHKYPANKSSFPNMTLGPQFFESICHFDYQIHLAEGMTFHGKPTTDQLTSEAWRQDCLMDEREISDWHKRTLNTFTGRTANRLPNLRSFNVVIHTHGRLAEDDNCAEFFSVTIYIGTEQYPKCMPWSHPRSRQSQESVPVPCSCPPEYNKDPVRETPSFITRDATDLIALWDKDADFPPTMPTRPNTPDPNEIIRVDHKRGMLAPLMDLRPGQDKSVVAMRKWTEPFEVKDGHRTRNILATKTKSWHFGSVRCFLLASNRGFIGLNAKSVKKGDFMKCRCSELGVTQSYYGQRAEIMKMLDEPCPCGVRHN